MLHEKLKKYNLILASGSPRRQQIFKDLGLEFEIRIKSIKEDYPEHLNYTEICDYLARLKAIPFENELNDNDILITSDTIVWHNNKAIGKPKTRQDAFVMIKSLSNSTHEVLTSVNFKTTSGQKTVNAITKVTFEKLTDEEISYYINNFETLDKAGAYGIQDWIGLVAVKCIEGSYLNVMGFPVHLVYKTLNEIVDNP